VSEDQYEVRISVYRRGRRISFNDGLGDSPTFALANAHNDLELWAERYEADRPKEFDR
jgi:hypothetical protein